MGEIKGYWIKPSRASIEDWKTWVAMGYLGSYDQYLLTKRENDTGLIHIRGDLGPHCTECAAPSDSLCDYPVGDGKTCDRNLCEDHCTEVAADVHYCRGHFIEWSEYLASERGYEVLHNVTPMRGMKKDAS